MRVSFKNASAAKPNVGSVIDLTSRDGLSPGSPGDQAHPRLVLRCQSVTDVVQALAHAAETGEHLVPRGGGHCFANRSSTDGIVVDLAGLSRITVDGGVATIGAGARLGAVYAALHDSGRTIPAGCGDTVGIAGLTLGGGIGLLGRQYGLTCDRLVGAQVVLADRSVVECDEHRESDLFWALRGAGGGQFGIVTELRFATVPEPSVCRIEGHWAETDKLVTAWQDWAPGAPDEMTVNLTVQTGRATLFGTSALPPAETEELLREFTARAGVLYAIDLRQDVPYSKAKPTFSVLDPEGGSRRVRSEFFSRMLPDRIAAELLGRLRGNRRLAFTAMGGAYNRVPEDATAFAHRSERFLLEQASDPGDPWVDEAWRTAHAAGSGRVYPNFPDLSLEDPASAYHTGNYPRLAALKKTYDPHRVFRFPQAL